MKIWHVPLYGENSWLHRSTFSPWERCHNIFSCCGRYCPRVIRTCERTFCTDALHDNRYWNYVHNYNSVISTPYCYAAYLFIKRRTDCSPYRDWIMLIKQELAPMQCARTSNIWFHNMSCSVNARTGAHDCMQPWACERQPPYEVHCTGISPQMVCTGKLVLKLVKKL